MITDSNVDTDAHEITEGVRMGLEVHADMEGDYSDDAVSSRARVSRELAPLLCSATLEEVIDALLDAAAGALDAGAFIIENNGNGKTSIRLQTKARALVEALKSAKEHAR